MMHQPITTGAELPFESLSNFRDLGGYQVNQGGHVKYGRFYRGPQLENLTGEADQTRFAALGIRVNFDFRSSLEREKHADPMWENIQYIAQSAIVDESGREINFDPNETMKMTNPDEWRQVLAELRKFYKNMPFNNEAFRAFFREINNENVPIYFHCSAGKDRTGVAAALLLRVLGVTRRDVMEDYMLSARYRTKVVESAIEKLPPEMKAQPEAEEFVRTALGVAPELLELALDEIKNRYRNFEEYLMEELGIDQGCRRRLQELYTEIG